jgi:hypothetical protein
MHAILVRLLHVGMPSWHCTIPEYDKVKHLLWLQQVGNSVFGLLREQVHVLCVAKHTHTRFQTRFQVY